MSNMHQGLDLSRFKKVSSDGKSTTLRHSKGHELRIAHSGLSPAMKERLDALETHGGGKVQRFAEGTPDAPVTANDSGAPAAVDQPDPIADAPAPAADPQQVSGAPAAPSPQEATLAPSANQQKSEASPLGAAEVPAQGAQNPAAGQAPNPTADYLAGKTSTGDYLGKQAAPPPAPPVQNTASIAQDLNTAHSQFQQDLELGHIKPETYASLFAKKDTLGKVGTLFGMLISGAGSGLAHQPNAVLGMMNKVIDNDLDAQKASNVNAQNWYRLSQQHEKQKAEVAKMAAESDLLKAQTGAVPSSIAKTQADAALAGAQATAVPSEINRKNAEADMLRGQTAKIPSEIGRIDAEGRSLNAETDIKANTLASTRAMGAAFQSLVDMTNKLPDGQAKQQAMQALGLLYPQYQQQVTDKNAAAAGLINYARSMFGSGAGSGAGGGAVDYGKMNQKVLQGQRKIPGGMTEQDVGNATKEAGNVNEVRTIRSDFEDSFKTLDDTILKGKLQPGRRAALVNALAATIARHATSSFNGDEVLKITSGLFPEAGDTKTTSALKLKKARAFFDALEAGSPTLDRFGLKKPIADPPAKRRGGNVEVSFPGKDDQSSTPAKKDVRGMPFKDGDTGVDKASGRQTVWRNGKWAWK